MSQALYRKWRPATFDQIVGQEHITRTLRNAVAADRIGHAYLFSGPRGTGKTTTARLLAKAANCQHEDPAKRPCNQCPPCQAINQGRFLDLIEIDAASNTGVDDIRDLREKINFSPSEGRFKVYIIDEVHMLSTAAFNALLKTLEEPPPHAKFVLATTEEHKVPLTIKSRCQPFTFRLLTLAEIIGRLQWLAAQETLTIEPEAVHMIAQHAAGSLRDAESLLDQLVSAPGDTISLDRTRLVLGTASNETVVALADAWLEGGGAEGLAVIHDALDHGADPRQFARQMVAYLRQLLLLQTAGETLSLNVTDDRKQVMVRQAQAAGRRDLIEAVKRFNEAAASQSGSWQPQLPLELAFIQLLPADRPPMAPSRPLAETASRQAASRPGEQKGKPAPQPEPVAGPRAEPEPAADPETVAESEPAEPAAAELTAGVVEEEVAETPAAAAPREEPPSAEPEATPEAAPEGTPDGALTLAAVKQNWPGLRDRLHERDRNLPALLASSKPLAVEGDTVILAFDFPVLKDKFERWPQARDNVCDVLSELLGRPCLVRTVITSQYTPPPTNADVDPADFAALAEELGGVVQD